MVDLQEMVVEAAERLHGVMVDLQEMVVEVTERHSGGSTGDRAGGGYGEASLRICRRWWWRRQRRQTRGHHCRR